jgi:hypothetical protein
MLFLLAVLADDGVDHSFENIVFWNDTFHIFNQIVCISSLVILEIVDDQVKTSLWNDVNEWWQNLESILSGSEDDQIMSQKVTILKNVSANRGVLQRL